MGFVITIILIKNHKAFYQSLWSPFSYFIPIKTASFNFSIAIVFKWYYKCLSFYLYIIHQIYTKLKNEYKKKPLNKGDFLPPPNSSESFCRKRIEVRITTVRREIKAKRSFIFQRFWCFKQRDIQNQIHYCISWTLLIPPSIHRANLMSFTSRISIIYAFIGIIKLLVGIRYFKLIVSFWKSYYNTTISVILNGASCFFNF